LKKRIKYKSRTKVAITATITIAIWKRTYFCHTLDCSKLCPIHYGT